MQAITVYHVLPAPTGWAVHTEESDTAFADKTTALRQGQELARASRGQLVIHRDDGSIQAEHSY